MNTWNSLPNWVISANTTNTFKNRLDKFWQNQEIIYDFQAQLEGAGSHSEVWSLIRYYNSVINICVIKPGIEALGTGHWSEGSLVRKLYSRRVRVG